MKSEFGFGSASKVSVRVTRPTNVNVDESVGTVNLVCCHPSATEPRGRRVKETSPSDGYRVLGLNHSKKSNCFSRFVGISWVFLTVYVRASRHRYSTNRRFPNRAPRAHSKTNIIHLRLRPSQTQPVAVELCRN